MSQVGYEIITSRVEFSVKKDAVTAPLSSVDNSEMFAINARGTLPVITLRQSLTCDNATLRHTLRLRTYHQRLKLQIVEKCIL